jgi:hypothetical protein
MSKNKKNGVRLSARSNSAKTLIERAKSAVPGFVESYQKFEQQMVLGGYSSSTLFNYSRSLASLLLYLKKSPLELDDDEVNSFSFSVPKKRKPAAPIFPKWMAMPKHMVYGLRFFSVFITVKTG